MRASPPVHLDLHGSSAERVLYAVLHGLAGAALFAWAAGWMHEPADDAVVLGVAAVIGAGAGVLLGLATHRTARGRLGWDGRAWRFGARGSGDTGDAPAGELRVMIDAGPWLLLRFEPAAGRRAAAARWLLVGRQDAASGTEWAAFRAAVYCPANPISADRPAAPDRPA